MVATYVASGVCNYAPTSASATSYALPTPSVVQPDDILVAHLHIETQAANTVTPPTGWTLVGGPTAGSTNYTGYTYWKRVTSADWGVTSYTWSWTTAAWTAGWITQFTGCVTTGDPFGGSSTQAGSAVATIPSLSYTAGGTGLGVWIYECFSDTAAYTGVTVPTGYTKQSESYNTMATVATRSGETAGAKTTGTASNTNGTSGQVAFAGELLDGATAATTGPYFDDAAFASSAFDVPVTAVATRFRTMSKYR